MPTAHPHTPRRSSEHYIPRTSNDSTHYHHRRPSHSRSISDPHHSHTHHDKQLTPYNGTTHLQPYQHAPPDSYTYHYHHEHEHHEHEHEHDGRRPVYADRRHSQRSSDSRRRVRRHNVEKRPSFGDTIVLIWETVLGAVTGRRR